MEDADRGIAEQQSVAFLALAQPRLALLQCPLLALPVADVAR